MSVQGAELRDAMVPEGVSSKDADKFFNVAVDVTSLPGEYSLSSSSTESVDPVESATEMAARVLTLSNRQGGRYQDDRLWCNMSRHGLYRLKDPGDTFAMITKFRSRASAAFEQQDVAFAGIMHRRNFSEKDIRRYCETGLLPRIIQLTHDFYLRLLYEIQHLDGKYPDLRKAGTASPARAMLDHHRTKLGEIRRNCLDKRQLLMQMYTYLRDSAENSFYDPTMQGAVWNRMAFISVNMDLRQPGTGGDGGTGGGGPPNAPKRHICKHCASRMLHTWFEIEHNRTACPLRTLPTAKKAKAARLQIINAKNENESADLQELLAQALVDHA